MLSLDECRTALGSMADDKSDDEIARMRDQAAAVARIVIRTYFGTSSAVTSPPADARRSESAQDLRPGRNGGRRLRRHSKRRRRSRLRRHPTERLANSRGAQRLRGERAPQS
jgi:hypothetical protein